MEVLDECFVYRFSHPREIALIEGAAAMIVEGRQPSRKGWKQRALTEARRTAAIRLGRWRRAEEAVRSAERIAAERAKRAAKIAAMNAAGAWELDGPYGSSYFGSGGGWGRVKVSANAETYGTHDNGFMAGPEGVRVLDRATPASFVARGGDAINDGRSWSEAAAWDPPTQAWVQLRRGALCEAMDRFGERVIGRYPEIGIVRDGEAPPVGCLLGHLSGGEWVLLIEPREADGVTLYAKWAIYLPR